MGPSGPCHWVETDLCSACSEPALAGSVLRAKDIEQLINLPNLHLELTPPQAFMLLGVVQLAMRHPELQLNDGVALFAAAFGRSLQKCLSVSPNLAAACEDGWGHPPEPKEESLIILPPGHV